MTRFNSYVLALLNWFYPKRCLLCERSLSYLGILNLCQTCLWNVKRSPINREDFIYFYGPFEGNLRELIHLLKYKGKEYLSKELSKILYTVWKESPELKECEIILPVPLHRIRLRERGFNQAAVLARGLLDHIHKNGSSNIKTTLEPQILIRTKNSRSQTKLNKEERGKNVKDAFQAPHGEKIHGKNVLLIDDVYTTGATLRCCRKLLESLGAKKVLALTLARD